MYIAEQANNALFVEVTVKFGEGLHLLKAKLPSEIRRNEIYTLKIHGKGAEMELIIECDGWETGSSAESQPSIAGLVDVENSTLSEGVGVNETRDTVFVPYHGSDFVLALMAEADATVTIDGSVSGVEVSPYWGKGRSSLEKIAEISVRSNLRMPGKAAERIHLDIYDKTSTNLGRVVLVIGSNPTTVEGQLHFDDDAMCDFKEYIDGELGTINVPSNKILNVEFDADESAWLKVSAAESEGVSPINMPGKRYRIIGGWKPNDPKADGRIQEGRLIISDEDGSNKETYTIRRINWGLPVVKIGETWWCKYNLRGNVKSFEDQITIPNDPAAQSGMTLFQYLTSCSAADFFDLWGWAYQGGSGQGMQVIEQNGVVVLERFTRDEKVHINKLDPKVLSPDGYELPSMEEFNRLFDTTDYIWMMYNGTHTLKNPWNGHSQIKRQQLRKNDIPVGTTIISDIIYVAMSSPDYPEHEPLVWYGPAAQWNDAGIMHSGHYNNILFGVYSPTGEGWYMNGGMSNLYLMKNGASSYDTRILRFKKSDVEYIY